MPVLRHVGRCGRSATFALLALALLVLAWGCETAPSANPVRIAGGDAERGRTAMRVYGCQSCHTIPGVPGANALVGPSLERIASRVYVAGSLPNTPDNLMRWIGNPRGVRPDTAMPTTGARPDDVRDMVAYLYTLR